MDEQETQHQTVGMMLDQFLNRIDTMSSTQLYAAIVAVTVLISFSLLGSSGGVVQEDVVFPPPTTTSKTTAKKEQRRGLREPKWFVLRWLNYAAIVGFIYSVYTFALHLEDYLQDSGAMLGFLTGWSLFLCYFFGFFGISFVDTDDLLLAEQQQSSEVATSTTTTTTTTSRGVIAATKPALHPPAASTPVCSDRNSSAVVNKTSTKKGMDLTGIADLPIEQVGQLVLDGKLKDHELEKRLDAHRAVSVRRWIVNQKLASLGRPADVLDKLPYQTDLDYSKVHGANCEIVVGYVPLPVGIVGPLTLNDESVYVPMATTEGCLVASTQRGAKAITQGGGATAVVLKDGITRAPCVRMASAADAAKLKLWCEVPQNFQQLKAAFESTTSFGKLLSCNPTVAGRNVYLRLCCFSGDAMGMNMVSKGSLAVIDLLKRTFPQLQLVALSGNMCTDKKAAATNWLEGRGKSVVVEATIPQAVVRSTLKTTVHAICETNLHKNLVGSAMAGVIGGFNAHASNIVSAVFLATGQDPAQNVESSNCITLLEETPEGDLWISCTMPSIEVGTVGGGTTLAAQAACLAAMGVAGGGTNAPGEHAKKLATMVAAATMAGELSLLAALAANTLVAAHMKHNRKSSSSSKK
eukprot:CAMPEP_0194043422 /NCGR_PEP_ID=MMETSP0009_2-20130614/15053_1 /TAXON_ID=210454 /ORGANISM="Grammatophora oceanica, Strain CCMP 410" /LENGTH=635 /DNA_ID=CAMNT_0038687623 /DNA_START=65 /DNA_END=1972 /DNA_ORIENTATION=-